MSYGQFKNESEWHKVRQDNSVWVLLNVAECSGFAFTPRRDTITDELPSNARLCKRCFPGGRQ